MEARSHSLYSSSTHRRDKGDLPSLRQLLPYLKPYKGLIFGACIALIFTSVAVLGMGAALRYLVDFGISAGDPALLDQGYFIMLGVVGLLAAASFARFYFVSSIGERLVADIRRDVFAKVVQMHMGFFETTRTGELLSRMTADTTLLQSVFAGTLSVAIRNGLLIIGGTTLLLITSGKLTGMVFLMLPAVIIPIVTLGRKVRFWSREAQARLADVNVEAEETVHGIRTIQSLSLESYQQQRFTYRVQEVLDASLKRIGLRGWLTAIVIGLVFGAVMTVLWMGGRDVLAGRISSGELSSFVFYAIIVAGATGAISDIIGDLQRAAGATERLLDLLNEQSEITSPEHPKSLPQRMEGRIVFDKVNFNYPSRPDTASLSDISFEVTSGETVAIVGPSGAGKTTLLQLLQRFYEPQSGSITLEGIDINELELTALRQEMGLVPQDAVIFSTTVEENIRFGRIDASDSEIEKAAELAAALEFIQELPKGMATYVGEKGVRLSGGQRQRIAIARALLRNPCILLLDEATSALDAENERLVQQAIDRAMADRTTLVIAHRLATVKRADRIIVLNQGRIDAIGTHEELLKSSELYARLAKLQFTA
ncbi:MAG: ABC transporter transmembrane domain-containing protein [Rickettsiales bacterium]|nr:ABC transporter transmembrane domain-containing protein [Rickettsiales bacterium]